MEQKLIITVAILSILFNVFFFLSVSNDIVDNYLLNKTTISFDFTNNKDVDSKEEFLNKIKKFSEDNNVEIAQYSFLSTDKIDIYSTMKGKYKEILFIPNFVFNRNIKVHNFNELLNVGFKNILYIDSKDKDTINRVSETLKENCEIYNVKMEMKNNYFSFNKFFFNENNNYLNVFLLYFLIVSFIIIFYYSMSKKRYLIHKMWGYSNAQIYYIINKPLFISSFLIMWISNFLISEIIYKNILSQIAVKTLIIMLKLNITTILLMFILSIPLFSILCSIANNIRKRELTKMIIVSFGLRMVLFLIIMFSSEQFIAQNTELKEQLNSLKVWKSTENLYNLYDSYPAYDKDDLVKEDIQNEKILKIYKELCDLGKVFIIKTTNFERPKIQGLTVKNEEDIEYSYKVNVNNEEDLYSPYGKNILVDKNYLKKHVVKSVNGENVINMLDNDDDVLNILVPQRYKGYENTIENSFKEWFYFQKVEVTNMYKQARGELENKKSINDLKINLIYIESGQKLFTYNPNSGNASNYVQDSIITVYTENVDNSILAACMGSYIFIESINEYSALKEINSITQKYNIIELNSISSVYDKKGEEIRSVEACRDKLIINVIIMSLFLVIFIMVIVYMYYKSSFSTIIIKSLQGYSFFEIYKPLILTNLFLNMIMLFIEVIIIKKIELYMIVFSLLMTSMDYFIAKFVNKCLIKNGEIQFITGE